MDAIDCIRTRMSIRKFKLEPVPKEILFKIIDTAKWSPSYKNSQPWEVAIVSGNKKEELSKMLIELFEKGEKPCPDISEPKTWTEEINNRIADHLKKRAKVTGIDLTDPELVKKAKIANFKFYGAPHVIYLYQDSQLSEWSIFDMGLFAQSLMLAAHSYGIGTVPQAFVTDYAKYIKNFLNIPDTKRIILGISIGYPNLTHVANSYRSERINTEEIIKWFD